MGLLVLSRHRNEVIEVGDDVRIVLVDIRGDRARIGVEAPPDVPVHRQEVADEIRREGKHPARPRPHHRAELFHAALADALAESLAALEHADARIHTAALAAIADRLHASLRDAGAPGVAR